MHVTSKWSIAARRPLSGSLWRWENDADPDEFWHMVSVNRYTVTTRRNEETKYFELLVRIPPKIDRKGLIKSK